MTIDQPFLGDACRLGPLARQPEGFWKRGPVEYLFYRKLRELKIETPGFSLSHFKIAAATSTPALAEQVQAEELDPILFGKPATQMTGERLSARMQIRSADTLEYALVTVVVKRGRSMLGELPICTTFPMFDYAIESLDSLQWDSTGS